MMFDTYGSSQQIIGNIFFWRLESSQSQLAYYPVKFFSLYNINYALFARLNYYIGRFVYLVLHAVCHEAI